MNLTDSTLEPSFDRALQADWIVPVTINIALFLATLWVVTSLLYYGRKTGKWRRIESSNFDKLNAGLIYSSVVVVGLMCAIYLIFTLVYINIGFEAGRDELCDAVADLTTCFYALVLFAVMVFLWLRQRTFYAHSILQATYSKLLKVFSSGSIIIVFISGLVAVIVRASPDDHISTFNGCVYQPNGDLITGYVVYFFATLFFGQLVLLGLFVYALKKTSSGIRVSHGVEQSNSQQQTTNSANTSSNNNKPSLQQSNTNDKVKVILRKTFLFALLSILLDTVLQVALFYVRTNERTIYSFFVVNAFLNLLFIILSFVESHKMLFSPCFVK